MLFNHLCSHTGVLCDEVAHIEVEHVFDPAKEEESRLRLFYSEAEVRHRCDIYGLTALKSFTDEVEFVSLGSYCLVTMALQSLGLRRSAYPLDYTRSSARGVIDLFATRFADFLTGTPIATPEHAMSFQDTAWGGSFWHHDISDPAISVAMHRRVDRLLGVTGASNAKPRIFCRAANSTSELDLTLELLDVLQSTYTGPVRLLILIENQAREGAIRVQGEHDLLFYRVGHKYSFASCHEERMLGYMEPLALAIKYWAGEPTLMAQVSTLADIGRVCDTIYGGDPANTLFAAALQEPACQACPTPTNRQVPSMLSGVPHSLGIFHEDARDDEDDWFLLSKLLPRNLVKVLEMHLSASAF